MHSIIRRSFASLFVVVSLVSALSQIPPPAEIPTDLDGPWIGEIRYGDESGIFGLEFARQSDGRVLARIGALDRATGATKRRRPLPLIDTGYIAGILSPTQSPTGESSQHRSTAR